MLVKDSALHALVSGRHEIQTDKDGNYFIDRDPLSFKLMLNYLRNCQNYNVYDESKKDMLAKELEYWQINDK